MGKTFRKKGYYDSDNRAGIRYGLFHVRSPCKRRRPQCAERQKGHLLPREPLDADKLREAINATGYQVGGITSAPYEKKGLFSFLHK